MDFIEILMVTENDAFCLHVRFNAIRKIFFLQLQRMYKYNQNDDTNSQLSNIQHNITLKITIANQYHFRSLNFCAQFYFLMDFI